MSRHAPRQSPTCSDAHVRLGRLPLALALALPLSALLLTACGGGGGDADGSATASSVASGESESSSATLSSADASAAVDATLSTAQMAVATGYAGTDITCPGGGHASYTLSSGSDNGVIDAGDVYALTFTQCSGVTGAVAVSGQVLFSVTSANALKVGGTVQFSALQAVLPQSTVTLTGTAVASAGLLYSRNGNTLDTQVTSSLSASQLSVSRTGPQRTTAYTLNSLSFTSDTTYVAGVVSSRTLTGSATVSANLLSGSYSASFSADADVAFSNGQPASGNWTVTTPNLILSVQAASGQVTVTVDRNKDGSIDRTTTWTTTDWSDSEGS
jgi:hypothetical protein